MDNLDAAKHDKPIARSGVHAHNICSTAAARRARPNDDDDDSLTNVTGRNKTAIRHRQTEYYGGR